MTESEEVDPRSQGGRSGARWGALAFALGMGLLSAVSSACSAAERSRTAQPAGVPPILASITVLSDTAMAGETGTGLHPAAIIGDTAGHPRVLLWDELKISPQLAPISNATATIDTGGPGK